MKHFKDISSLENLKKQFRSLAMENHPDKGGDSEIMKQINNEYDNLFPIWKNISAASNSETSYSTRSEFYTQNGWKGENYSSNLGTKEIAAIIRNYVKEIYSDCKFSVRYESYSGGSSFSVRLMEAPFNIFEDGRELESLSINQYHLGASTQGMTENASKMIIDIVDLINSYRMDDSDGMIDYFHTNFYYSVAIGSYDKPFKVVAREKKARDMRQYETVEVTEIKKSKELQAIEVPYSGQKLQTGMNIKIKSSFNHGISRGFIYQIQTVDEYSVRTLKLKKNLKEKVTSYNTRGNTFNATIANFEKWLQSGASTIVEIKEVTVEKEVKKQVKRLVRAENDIETTTESSNQTKNDINCTISKDINTKTHDNIYVLKIGQKLSKDDYMDIANRLKFIGGYYSKFKKGFIFKSDPRNKLVQTLPNYNIAL